MAANSGTKLGHSRANALVMQTFGVENEDGLRHCLTEAHRAQECKDIVKTRIHDLAHRLAMPLDAPSWGPSGPKKHNGHWQIKEAPRTEGDRSLIPTIQREAIVDNLERSERYRHFSGLYAIFALLALLVTACALYVDYQIMNEFWTRALANEFMEVPKSLASSVISKSLQVVFATLAFHFLLSKLSNLGRTLFVLLFFLMTFAMVAGFGFLNAQMSLPAQVGGMTSTMDAPNSLSRTLSDLGLDEQKESVAGPATENPATAPVSAQDMRQIEWVTWLVSPGVVFLVVTAIGALCLHVAETNVQNFVKSREYRRRLRRVEELDALERWNAMIDRYLAQKTGLATADQNRTAASTDSPSAHDRVVPLSRSHN
jgi:hypothetical protein